MGRQRLVRVVWLGRKPRRGRPPVGAWITYNHTAYLVPINNVYTKVRIPTNNIHTKVSQPRTRCATTNKTRPQSTYVSHSPRGGERRLGVGRGCW
jgi:hypothetical protein